MDVPHLAAKIEFLVYGPSGHKDSTLLRRLFVNDRPKRSPRDVTPIEVVDLKMLARLIGEEYPTLHGDIMRGRISDRAAQKLADVFQFDLNWPEWLEGSAEKFGLKYGDHHHSRMNEAKPTIALTGKPVRPSPEVGRFGLAELRLVATSCGVGTVTLGASIRRLATYDQKRECTYGVRKLEIRLMVTPASGARARVRNWPEGEVRHFLSASGPVEATMIDASNATAPIISVGNGRDPIDDCSIAEIADLLSLAPNDLAIGVLAAPTRHVIECPGEPGVAANVHQLNSRAADALRRARRRAEDGFSQQASQYSEKAQSVKRKKEVLQKDAHGFITLSWHPLRFEGAA